ncbi:MAG: ATP-dependent zinc metalloprotease FtsH [Actinobacteria bacterium]|nr:ATP-dependent zinc metalloprotease FtsH [Actinomycetota bacterium]
MTAGLILLLAIYAIATLLLRPSSPGHRLRFDEFVTDVRAGKIRSATVYYVDRRVAGTYDGGSYWLDYGTSDSSPLFADLLNEMGQANLPVGTDQQWFKSLLAGPQVTVLLPSLILVDGLVLAFLLIQGGGLLGFGRSGSRRVATGESKITFADVAGVDEARAELVEIRDFLADPARYQALGARVPKGILLIGPPGCGKTLLARAVAGEAGVPFFSISGSAFVEMYVGVGAARIRDLFSEAYRAAPSIVFIDELDAVGRGRGGSGVTGQEERESTLNQLLVGLDGFDSSTGVVVLGATNRPDVLDAALLRPGRFDRRVVVDPPDVSGRLAILKVHSRGKPLATDVDLGVVARRTPGFSGADLASVVNEATLLAARQRASHVTTALLWQAVERVMSGPERRSKVLGPTEKQLLAYHECGHAVVSLLVGTDERVNKISIVARGTTGGFTWVVPSEDHSVSTRAQLEARLAVMLAGRAAEELVSGEPTSAAENDLRLATELGRRMVNMLGMGERLGPISLAAMGAPRSGPSEMGPSPQLAALADEEVRSLLVQARTRAGALLVEHRDHLDRLASRLQEVETLEGSELDALLYPTAWPVRP